MRNFTNVVIAIKTEITLTFIQNILRLQSINSLTQNKYLSCFIIFKKLTFNDLFSRFYKEFWNFLQQQWNEILQYTVLLPS